MSSDFELDIQVCEVYRSMASKSQTDLEENPHILNMGPQLYQRECCQPRVLGVHWTPNSRGY
jgi:hypothetical protein